MHSTANYVHGHLLFPVQVKQTLANAAKKDGISDTHDAMFNYFIERVRNNLHVILCMSPVGEPFRYNLG